MSSQPASRHTVDSPDEVTSQGRSLPFPHRQVSAVRVSVKSWFYENSRPTVKCRLHRCRGPTVRCQPLSGAVTNSPVTQPTPDVTRLVPTAHSAPRRPTATSAPTSGPLGGSRPRALCFWGGAGAAEGSPADSKQTRNSRVGVWLQGHRSWASLPPDSPVSRREPVA